MTYVPPLNERLPASTNGGHTQALEIEITAEEILADLHYPAPEAQWF